MAKTKPTREVLECLRCGFLWIARIMGGQIRRPRVCPSCKSPYWDRPRERGKKG